MLARLKEFARRIRRDVIALAMAAGDRRTPLAAKLVAAAIAAYALSPIDLIPDVIPVLGFLDELVLLPLGIMLAVRLIPPALMAEFRSRADNPPPGWARAGLVIVAALWVAAAALVAWLVLARG